MEFPVELFHWQTPQWVDLLEGQVRGLAKSYAPDLLNKYDHMLTTGHPFASKLPLMNPFHVVLLTLAYLAIVLGGVQFMKYWGKNFKKSKPLKYFALAHNASLVFLSAYMAFEAIRMAFVLNFSLFGNPIDDAPTHWPLAKILWLFYASKIIEWIDTFIMILKGNFHQVSFLHVYHHASIFIVWWIVVFWGPGGDGYFSASQNSLVHVVMYTYYFFTILGYQVWFKPYITQVQMYQFVANMVQASYILLFVDGEGPHYPFFLAHILFWYMITLLGLFMNFYVRSFKRPAGAASGVRGDKAAATRPKKEQ